MLRVAYKAATRPVWDAKNSLWVYPDNVSLPDGFIVYHIEPGTTAIRDNMDTPHNAIRMILVKEDKLVKRDNKK